LPHQPAPFQTGTPHILVVDDDPAIVEVMTMVLAAEGYPVLAATNGQEALSVITTQRPALVLLDLNMPVMSGWDLIERLRTSAISVPVVLVTAGQLAREEAARLNVAGHLAKPFNLDDLLAIVARFAVRAAPTC
jgi:CheY-like chemotaxis protein